MSRKWITTLLTPEATSTQVKVLFLDALDAEGLLDELEWRLDHPHDVDLAADTAPILLAVSDNGPEMRSDETRAFMALVTIGQHFGRPSTPTDQAWIETLWGHIKAENPHLLAITDPAVLKAELDRVRSHYNQVRPMKASATSPRRTNTKAAATRSAKPAATDSKQPTPPAVAHTGPQQHDQRG